MSVSSQTVEGFTSVYFKCTSSQGTYLKIVAAAGATRQRPRGSSKFIQSLTLVFSQSNQDYPPATAPVPLYKGWVNSSVAAPTCPSVSDYRPHARVGACPSHFRPAHAQSLVRVPHFLHVDGITSGEVESAPRLAVAMQPEPSPDITGTSPNRPGSHIYHIFPSPLHSALHERIDAPRDMSWQILSNRIRRSNNLSVFRTRAW